MSASLDDEDPATAPITATGTPSPSTGNQTWAVTVPAGQASALTDGTLTASSTFTTPPARSAAGR